MVRLRHRYVVVEFEFNDDGVRKYELSQGSLMKCLVRSIKDLHGIRGYAVSKSGLYGTYLNADTKIGFIRMRRSAYTIVTSALSTISSIEGQPCAIRSLYTGATIRHCNIFLHQYQKRQLESAYGNLKTDVQRKEFELALENIKSIQVPLFRK